jgi:hypothetical protein
MKINEVIGEWMIMPQSIKPMGLIRKPGGGFDFKNKGNNRANEAPIEQDKDNPIAKPYVDMPEWKALHDMDDEIIQAYIKHKEVKEKAPPGREKQVKALKKKFKDKSAPYAIAWAQHNKHGKPKEDAAGVGIVTKQNATKDVPVGGEYKNVKKLGL